MQQVTAQQVRPSTHEPWLRVLANSVWNWMLILKHGPMFDGNYIICQGLPEIETQVLHGSPHGKNKALRLLYI